MGSILVSQMGDGGETPHLKRIGGDTLQLHVRGRPFLMRAAELQNSSLSCPEYMASVWPKLVETNVNTVLGCVTWEAIEPREGVFDFSRLDKIIADARLHEIHLILLWFGAYKNGRSTYVPSWVKKNAARFPRAMIRNSVSGRLEMTEVLSPFVPEAAKADARAFRSLMHHLQIIDGRYSTVIMVQVENEIGLLGDSRDRNKHAEHYFKRAVPEKLKTMLLNNWHTLYPTLQANLKDFRASAVCTEEQTWEEAFGACIETDEIFMAYHFALFAEHVAAAGRDEYNIPLFTNVWQNYAEETCDNVHPTFAGGGGRPGDYPSGGSVINVLDIWQLFAPSIDFIAPDIYLNDYDATCLAYRHRRQPLMIPEQRRDEFGARRIWCAYGSHQALCASPFGIDTLEPASNPFTRHYSLLHQISQPLLSAQERRNSTFGFFFDEYNGVHSRPATWTKTFGDWNLSIERSFVFGKPGPGFGMIIHLQDARFLLVGEGFQVRFTSLRPEMEWTGILSFVEKVVVDADRGEMRDGRMLNGDETRSGEVAIMPNLDPSYGDFPIAVTVPARTRIAECEVYALPHASASV